MNQTVCQSVKFSCLESSTIMSFKTVNFKGTCVEKKKSVGNKTGYRKDIYIFLMALHNNVVFV